MRRLTIEDTDRYSTPKQTALSGEFLRVCNHLSALSMLPHWRVMQLGIIPLG